MTSEELERIQRYFAQLSLPIRANSRLLREITELILIIAVSPTDFYTIPPRGFCGWLALRRRLNLTISLNLKEDQVYHAFIALVERERQMVDPHDRLLAILLGNTLSLLRSRLLSPSRDYADLEFYLPQDNLLYL